MGRIPVSRPHDLGTVPSALADRRDLFVLIQKNQTAPAQAQMNLSPGEIVVVQQRRRSIDDPQRTAAQGIDVIFQQRQQPGFADRLALFGQHEEGVIAGTPHGSANIDLPAAGLAVCYPAIRTEPRVSRKQQHMPRAVLPCQRQVIEIRRRWNDIRGVQRKDHQLGGTRALGRTAMPGGPGLDQFHPERVEYIVDELPERHTHSCPLRRKDPAIRVSSVRCQYSLRLRLYLSANCVAKGLKSESPTPGTRSPRAPW